MREPLDIAICTQGLPITGQDPARLSLGGSETAVVSVACALARAGNRVRVFCNAPGSTSTDEVDFIPVTELRSYLDRDGCDLLLSSRYHRLLEQPLSARMVGLWHHDMPTADFFRQNARGLSRASFSMFVSRFQADEYERCVPGLSRHTWVTSNGVDFDALEGAVGQARRTEVQPLFIYGSRPERGLDFLLQRIWPRIVARHREAKLLVSSYDINVHAIPPEVREYYAFCRQLIAGTEGVVELGSLSRFEFWRELARCTAVLYPTAFPEVSCMVALEAQAAGVPIVTTDAFALSETVGFRETLVRAPFGTQRYVEEFVTRVRRLVEDEDFSQRARQAGREHVCRESHSWDAIAVRWTEFFFEQFRERFERNRAGVLRSLLRESQTEAASRLVASVNGEQAGSEPGTTGRAPSVEERVFRIRPQPTVSATILVKDEEANIRRCIESFQGAVDEIVVGDTGSIDMTVEMLRSMGFAETPVEPSSKSPPATRRLVHIDFTDFSQARNDLAACTTADYLFWQDGDEILFGAEELRRWVDENVFYDALAIEQRHIAFDQQIEPNHPVRCFRPVTEDGPLQWVGCVHEFVEHDVNRPPLRTIVVPEIYVGHLGYDRREVRLAKAKHRNLALLRRDRTLNPDRMMGFVLGMREYLNLAKYDMIETGELTDEGYRCLNLGFEVWDRHVKSFPHAYRGLGFWISREILGILAKSKLVLRSTGQVPFEVDYSFSAQRGVLETDGRDIPRQRLFYATVDELREEFGRRLDRLDAQLGVGFIRPSETLAAGRGRSAERELPPTLFGIESEEKMTAGAASRVRPIVSLTTIPSRLNELSATLDTLLGQTLPPERILVAIPNTCRNRDGRLRKTDYGELPVFLKHPSIEVIRCDEDFGSLTKLIPALQTLRRTGEDDRPLVTVDDDARYAATLLDDLSAAGEKYPDHVIATEGERIDRPHSLRHASPGRVLSDWQKIDIMQGCGGVLYRSSFFGDDFFDMAVIESVPECMGEDDYWIAGYLALRGVQKLHIPGPAYYEVIEATQAEALNTSNPWAKREAVIRYYQSRGIWMDHWRFGGSPRSQPRASSTDAV